MSTIAILADIHGNLPALEAVVNGIRYRELETVINLGNHATDPLWPHETLALMTQQDGPQIAKYHDRQRVVLC